MATTRKKVTVDVEQRTLHGSGACGRLRAAGRVPANVYGLSDPPFPVTVHPGRIEEILQSESGRNTILTLTLAGGEVKRDVLLRELQRDPVTDRLIHVEFLRIDPTKELHLRVPVRLVGLATGVKNEGGILDFVQREVEVLCLPDRIPEHLDVDVSELHLGQHVTVADLGKIDGVRVLDAEDTVLALVAAPKVTAEASAAEAAAEGAPAAGEPDAEKKGKETEGAGD